jgi:hypothetical protein
MFDAPGPAGQTHYRPILPHEANPIPVGVAIRIVPAGVVTVKDGQGKSWRAMRAALQLSPVAGKRAASCGLTVDLANWPADIENLLRASDTPAPGSSTKTPIQLLLTRVDDNIDAPRAAPEPASAKSLWAHRALFYDHRTVSAKPLTFAEWQKQRLHDTGRIDGLWRELVAPGERSDWERLVELLAQRGDDAVQQRYQLGDDKNALDIAGVGRGEAAMLLSLERGLGLVKRVSALARGGCGHRSDECNLVAREKNVPLPDYSKSADEQAAADIEKQQKQQQETREAQRKVAQGIAEREGKRNTTTSRSEFAKAYRDMLECLTPLQSANSCLKKVADAKEAAAKEAEIARDIEQAKNRHALASSDPNRLTNADLDPTDKSKEVAKNAAFERERAKLNDADKALLDRLQAIQSQPSLARLFNLTVDILVPLGQFLIPGEQWHAFPERPGVTGYSRFGFLAAALPKLQAQRRVWTATKFRLDVSAEDIWACSRAEIDLFTALSDNISERNELIAQGALPQVDGVVDLGVGSAATGGVNPRFDLITLDVVAATENRSTAADGRDLLTLRTAGLALIDRWRQGAAIGQAVRSRIREGAVLEAIVIDAEDLTVGYRLDVAVRPGGQGNFIWRSLCNRSIRFGDEAGCVDGVVGWRELEALLSRLIPSRDDRAAYDGALLLMPTRVSDRLGANGKPEEGKTADVEDIVGQWQGPPIGVDPESGAIALSAPSALRLSQLYSLSQEAGKTMQDAWRIPQLCFSHGYSVGLAPSLAGGIVRRLDPAGTCYIKANEERVVLPPKSAGPRRFLRHESIAAPLLTTPLAILKRNFDGLSDGLRESSRLAVFRSEPGTKPEVFKPKDAFKKEAAKSPDTPDQVRYSPRSRTHRVVVPPAVSAQFADRHRCFAGVTKLESYAGTNKGPRWSGPPGGLRDVDYDRPAAGGFPVWGRTMSSNGAFADGVSSESGDAVFQPKAASNTSERPAPYYPDPAASHVVIAARDMAGHLLPGKPLVVPLRPGKIAFPEVRPIVLDFCAADALAAAPRQNNILGLDMGKGVALFRDDNILSSAAQPATVWLDADGIHAEQRTGRIAATRVEVALAPGEGFEIDLWCLPTQADLVRWFDVVQSATLVVALDAKTGLACTEHGAFADRLKSIDPKTLDVKAGDLLGKLRGASSTAKATICCEGQQRLTVDALTLMGDHIHKLARKRVTPEIAGRTTIQAVHAILRPARAPELVMEAGAPTPRPTLRLERRALRRGEAAAAKAVEAVKAGPATPGGESPAGPTATSGVFVSGTVRVDRWTTGFLEVEASGIGLMSGSFDDERRRRSTDEVARGLWPRSPISNGRVDAKDIYGFNVCSDGRVRFDEERAILLRVDEDVPSPDEAPAPRDLSRIQAASDEAKPDDANIARASRPFRIADTRARIVTLQVRAGGRTGWCFRNAKGDILKRASRSAGEGGASNGDNEETVLATEPVRVALEAAKEPSRVEPLTILPAFALTEPPSEEAGVFVVQRIAKLRLRMRRPWFSSGAGERLGIVLWPPDLHACSVDPSGRTVSRGYDVAMFGEQPDIDLGGWSDLDLGPGGAYVSRWGADPTKGGIRGLEWIMPLSAFADLQGAAFHADAPPSGAEAFDVLAADADAIEHVYVPRASMPLPLPVDRGAVDGGEPDRLTVALLTYVPRFDIDSETWFVDVAIKPGATPDPFVRLGLVRYQPNAPAELRVSQPVVEWAQILNARTVTVRLDKNAKKRVEVIVSGAAKRFSARGTRGHDTLRIDSWLHRPLMKISILRRNENGVEEVARLGQGRDGAAEGFSSFAERTWIPRDQAELTCRLELKPEKACANSERPIPHAAISPTAAADNGELTWTAAFDLEEEPLGAGAGVVYSVLVEEVEATQPATYPSEPFVPEDTRSPENEALVVSGPRFAARVTLSPPAQAGSPGAKTR